MGWFRRRDDDILRAIAGLGRRITVLSDQIAALAAQHKAQEVRLMKEWDDVVSEMQDDSNVVSSVKTAMDAVIEKLAAIQAQAQGPTAAQLSGLLAQMKANRNSLAEAAAAGTAASSDADQGSSSGGSGPASSQVDNPNPAPTGNAADQTGAPVSDTSGNGGGNANDPTNPTAPQPTPGAAPGSAGQTLNTPPDAGQFGSTDQSAPGNPAPLGGHRR